MAGTARRWRELYGVSRHIGLGLAALCFLPTAAGAADLNLLATTSGNVNDAKAGGLSSSQQSLSETLDMNYNRAVTPQFSYRLLLREFGTTSSNTAASSSTRSTTGSVEPGLDMTFSGLKYSLNVGGRLREAYSDASQSPSLLQTEDFQYVRAFLTPDLFPHLLATFERTADRDDRTPRGLDQENIRAVLGATYSLAEKLNLAYTLTSERRDDSVARRTQEQRSHVATLNYADNFFADRLAVNGNYLATRVDTEERTSLTGVSGGVVAAPQVLSGAFSLLEDDPTVAAASKVPPATYATLTTSISTILNLTVPLTVSEGGAPNRNQSIAVGLPPGVSITTIRLTVSPRAGDLRDISLQAQGVSFQIFAGAGPQINLSTWTAVPIVSVTAPTTFNSYFEITIGATGGSFIKIHVAADMQQPPLPPLTATAVQAFSPSAPGGRVDTGNFLQSFSGGITVQPLTQLSINGNVNFNTNRQDPSGRRDDSGTYSVIATGTPHRLLTATALYQNSFTTSNDPQTQRTGTWNGSVTLSSSPLPTLTASLSGSRTESNQGGVTQTRADSLSLNTAMVPFRHLNVDVSTALGRSQNFVDGSTSRNFSATLSANGRLTARLSGLLGYTFGASEVSGGLAPSSAVTSSTFLSLTYTVSRFLNASSRWDFSASDGNFTLTQQYRLDVKPTLKTSVFLTFLRTDQHAETGSSSTNTATLNGSWNISRHLDLNTTASFTHGSQSGTVYTVSGTLSFRL